MWGNAGDCLYIIMAYLLWLLAKLSKRSPLSRAVINYNIYSIEKLYIDPVVRRGI